MSKQRDKYPYTLSLESIGAGLEKTVDVFARTTGQARRSTRSLIRDFRAEARGLDVSYTIARTSEINTLRR